MIHLGESLSAHLDGELSVGEARLVAGHLEVCGACRAEFDDLAAARAAVRTLPALELPDSIVAAIPRTERRRPRMPAPQWAAAAAAVLALAVGSAALLDEPPPEPISASDLGAVYVARVSVDRVLPPTPRYVDAGTLFELRGGE
ncbi:MAG: zf-HC2 domain-containing protein [Acidimicrobiia bacterium]|nr:zf-HC2 domain-containing protein [Acidimicrobiia bacterium]